MTEKDTYKTIETPTEAILFKDKNSKFYGFAYPIQSENDVKQYIDALKKKHHAARHWCFAYQLGTETTSFRANDDGEPNNSAGMPIYGQIQSFDVTNILIVVVRYFGGVKLGVSGLINAYRTTAQLTLEASKIVEKTINIEFCITFEYKNMNKVMRVIKENNITINNQKLALDCNIYISVRKKDAPSLYDIFNNLFEIKITEIKN
ncbi:IMPACT family protein [Confluentibacter flavum]|uniref:YigZ family protein n=1 Tax=Confluentibacter flavum TaxID=1909700 RepID=A0A2N3HIR1_9FLAO|nr:YigZ family protein [Confluentibacter flavum]PKQ44855.1 YigZ family protein [Confluentibacter flavum]